MYEHSLPRKPEGETEEAHEMVSPLHEFCEGQVAKYKRPVYWTISPDPRSFDGYVKGHASWMAEIRRIMYNTCDDYIYVLELAGLRPHYHGVSDVKDQIGFNKRMFNASRYDNVKVHGKFKDGLSYIFKSCQDTYDRTGIVPVRYRDDDVMFNKELKKKRIEEAQLIKQSIEEPLNIGLKDWMINGL